MFRKMCRRNQQNPENCPIEKESRGFVIDPGHIILHSLGK